MFEEPKDDREDVLVQQFYSTAELAMLLGFDRETVSRWAREGNLPAFRVGRRWRFKKADIDEILDFAGND